MSETKYFVWFDIDGMSYFNINEKRQEKIAYKSQENDTEFPKLTRQYTFTCEQDFIDVKEGYCPKYAAWWMDDYNRKFWPKGKIIRHRPEYLRLKNEFQRKMSAVVDVCSCIKTNIQLSLSRSVSDSIVPYDRNTEQHKTVCFDIFREVIPENDH